MLADIKSTMMKLMFAFSCAGIDLNYSVKTWIYVKVRSEECRKIENVVYDLNGRKLKKIKWQSIRSPFATRKYEMWQRLKPYRFQVICDIGNSNLPNTFIVELFCTTARFCGYNENWN